MLQFEGLTYQCSDEAEITLNHGSCLLHIQLSRSLWPMKFENSVISETEYLDFFEQRVELHRVMFKV